MLYYVKSLQVGKLKKIEIEIISSKSYLHRALICNCLSGGKTDIKSIGSSIDVETTNAGINEILSGNDKIKINCNESGSSLRFLMSVAGALGKETEFILGERLKDRPMYELERELSYHGIKIEKHDNILFQKGKLVGGRFSFSGKVSSQFISSIMLAAPVINEDIEIVTNRNQVSKPYIDITIDVLSRFGINLFETGDGDKIRYFIPKQNYISPKEYNVPGDFSMAANFLLAGTIGDREVYCKGISEDDRQGDKNIIEIINSFGGNIRKVDGGYIAEKTAKLISNAKIDIRNTPDLIFVIGLLAAISHGKTEIIGIGNLKYKESDRTKSLCEALSIMGVDTQLHDEKIVIYGDGIINGGEIKCYNDHRLVMMCEIANLVSSGEVKADSIESVNKSYINFFDEIKKFKN